MRPFPRQCLIELRSALEGLSRELLWDAVECAPDSALGHEAGDVYCRAQFEHAGRSYDLYVYTDEAGANVDGQWFIHERWDCENDDAYLISAFVRFIQYCVSGTAPGRAYRLALRA